MRKCLLCLILAGFALPVFAANRVTVEQLQQLLAAAKAKPDADLAKQLSGLELTERLSSASLARLQATLPGENSRQTLVGLADASAFLDPPAAEIPSQPAPDTAEQRRIMALTVAYVVKTIPQLPNFFATRDTNRFEDTPQLQSSAGGGGIFFVPYQPLHPVGMTTATVFYRDGREAVDTGASKKPPPMTQGLTTMGVFGPILSTALLDAAQNKLAWSRWEQGANGPEAVFSYAVPKEKSHYEVNYCCVAEEAAIVAADLHPFRRVVGYHGEMAIDPATGTILRIVTEAELKPDDPVVTAAIMVEYGPIDIGGRTYFCPVRSVSLAKAQSLQFDPKFNFPLANQLQPLKTSLNDVAFEQYHVFRAETRLLTDEAADQPPASIPSGSTVSTGPAAPISSSTLATPAEPPSEAASASAPPASAVPAPPPAPTAAPAEPAIPEISVAAATGLPDAPSNAHLAQYESGFTLRTTARLVDVGVVAYDKKGHPVTDLKPEDFELYDNDRKQNVSFFSQAASEAAHVIELPTGDKGDSSQGQPVYSNRHEQSSNASFGSVHKERGATILMIDASHLAFGDFTHGRSEMLRFLKIVPPDEPVGLYALKSYGFQIILEPSTDRAQLVATLTKWMPTAQDMAHAQEEEQRNRQQVDFVHSLSDMTQLNGNGNTVPETLTSESNFAAISHPTDPSLLSMGSNPGRDALSIILGVSRHLAAIPGHKTLVWVTSDNVLADWTTQAAPKQEQGNRIIDSLALQAQETLNESHVSIYPLDASQLEVGGIGADLRERNAVPVGMTSRSPELAVLGDAAPGMKPGRITAQMQQDLHPIAGIYRDLAAATGGRALRRAGDIAAELDSIVADGRAIYMLGFSPDSPADGSYHHIKVALRNRRDIKLSYRTGYFYSKEASTIKERFQRALWQPADIAEIAVTANPLAAPKGAAIKLNIAATDLDLAQQGERWTGNLDIFLVQRDDEGLHAQVTGQTLVLRLKPDTYQKLLRDGLPFEMNVESRPQTASVRIVVVDANSGRMGSVTLPAVAIAAKQ
jgi:VWFA-related protein